MKSLYILFFFTLSLFAQKKTQLSPKAEISILTCAPGQNELYSSFGHSAIRVKDTANNLDRVYNYGTFDFNTPNFYLKFCQGKLLYQLSSYEFKYFPYTYYKENRWVKAQTLNLTKEQNQKVFDYLEWNALPENKDYQYDFFYDNCATKMHEVIEKSIGKVDFDYTDFPKDLTHRELIHLYLVPNSWAKFGIDLALGSVIDKKASLKQYMFLPDYVYSGFKNSRLNGSKLIEKENYVLPDYNLKSSKTNFFVSPLFIALLLFSFTLFSLVKKKKAWISTLSLLYGILGLVVFSLWFLTEHSTTKMNMNILWASPLLFLFPFIKNSLKTIVSYMGILQFIAFLIIGFVGFQQFNTSIYILAITIASIYINQILLTFKV
ncbi:lipoprotein N-acyltransferase Lnb domain-containing protein [Wenyingzhuangia aestuarii]|uniref:lipoprotein N-acyltransferase Lnb domain-containing protein n=1 Tax=Wenyingzhuangia aestuarii TaxID=1647582 RepID=UPI00143C6173|nr:DUF4105 domain-containing protein [Wenyingzhuangia aestuarii]NJB81757.1 hypothetical protein [Wenyingzhuangia aestuarii]